jgi:hypothetical protein
VISNTGLLQGDLLHFDCNSVDDNLECDVNAPSSARGKARQGAKAKAGAGAVAVEGTDTGEGKRSPGFFDSLIIVSDSASSAPSEKSSTKNCSINYKDIDRDVKSSEISGPSTTPASASALAAAPAPSKGQTFPQPQGVTSKAQLTAGSEAGRTAASSSVAKAPTRSWFDWIGSSQ